MLGPYRTQNVQATLDSLYITNGVLYRVVKAETDGDWLVIWVEPISEDRGAK